MLILTLKRKVKVDENVLAKQVAHLEGGKEQVNIGQIKEVQKILLDLLGAELRVNPRGVIALLRKHSVIDQESAEAASASP